ncbi:MAG: TrkA family potassium uptake protein [Euryarchaeota archaeon]|nr:TrkA family potassium uptake protein [Euryarchaeota archaeon]
MIVCGYNEITKNLGNATFIDTGFPDDRENFVWGDPADPNVLKQAGIDNEDTIIIATEDDTKNIYITLLARELNPWINIGVILKKQENVEKARRAGANNVMVESVIIGKEILNALLNPKVAELISQVMFSESSNIYAFTLPEQYVNKKLKNTDIRRRVGTVIAIKRGKKILKNPGANTVLKKGDVLIFFRK